MSRKSVLLVLLALLTVTVVPAFAETISLDQAALPKAQLQITSNTPGTTNLEWSAGSFSIEQNNGETVFRMQGERMLEVEETYPVAGGMVVLPWGSSARVEVLGGEIVEYSADYNQLGVHSFESSPVAGSWVELGKIGVMRDFTVAPVHVTPIQQNEDGKLYVARNLEIAVVSDGELDNIGEQKEREISSAC